MPCYKPLKGYLSKDKSKKTGGRQVVFKRGDSNGALVEVPCGQCYGCRLERSRQWALRIVKEQKQWTHNSFITLTYSPENLPEHGTLVKEHFTKFIKDLRYLKSHKVPGEKRQYQKIRYFHCGEYGEQNSRPHYHAILFNVHFEDMKLWKRTKSGELLYRSQTLEKLWPRGHSSIGNVTFESAAYVARYVMKKITGEQAEEHYKVITNFDENGEIKDSVQIQPEYVTMSRKPGIGNAHYDNYKNDMFPSDEISVLRNGETKHCNPPRYYMEKLRKDDPKMYEELKTKRTENMKKLAEAGENDNVRQDAKLQIKLAQTKNLKRHFEEFH